MKAFDTHQEVVTKRSLEVTMTKLDPADPLTTAAEFPTGPNALRLFIPNIDIGSGGGSSGAGAVAAAAAAAKRTRGEGGRDDGGAPSPNSDDCRKRPSNAND